jgi:hypothetical protein
VLPRALRIEPEQAAPVRATTSAMVLSASPRRPSETQTMMGVPMKEDDQMLLTALTLVLAKQIRAEKLAAGHQMTADPIDDAVNLIKQERVPITGRFGVRHF